MGKEASELNGWKAHPLAKVTVGEINKNRYVDILRFYNCFKENISQK